MLSADFGHLDRDTRMIDRSRAEWIHIDVMDGVFVPNISFGFPVLKAIDAASDKFMDVHLMIVEPERYVKRFAEAGAKAGISIKPATPVETIEQWLPMLDLVLVMSVEPGFGGQSFIGGSVEKVKRLRSMIDGGGFSTLIEIDGGVGPDNAGMLFAAGCDVLVAGSAIFRSPDPEATIVNMLEAK